MSRVRLTNRNAAVDKTPYPGDLGQTRTDPDINQYDNYEQTPGHELQDKRTEWKNDQRNDIGFGIPTQASIRAAASKAVKLASLLLGDKAPEDVIEAQARDFMRLGSKVLNESLVRFASTEALYAADEEKEEVKADDKEEVKVEASKKACSCKKADEEKKDDVKAEDKKDEVVASKKSKKADEEKKDEVKAEDKKDEVVASKNKKADEKEEVKADEDEEVVAADDEEVKADEDEMDVTAADDEEVEADEAEEVKAKKANELDVELGAGGMDEDVKVSEEDEKTLASLYADEEEVEPVAKKASEKTTKKGISKIGGQPKVASTSVKGGDELSSIWNSAPDVSSIFE